MVTVSSDIGTGTHAAQTGTLNSASLGATAISGSGTNFDPEFTTADLLIIDHTTAGLHAYGISAVTDDTNMTIVGGLVEALSGGETPYKQGTLRDHATIALWEAADGDGDGLGNDDCTGNYYNDSAGDEAVVINFSANSIVLTVPVGERHDGTEGTGARIVRTDQGQVLDEDVQMDTEWIEIDLNGNKGAPCLSNRSSNTALNSTFKNMLVHGSSGKSAKGIYTADRAFSVQNTFIYDIKYTSTDGGNISAIAASVAKNLEVYNTTCHDIQRNAASGLNSIITFGDIAGVILQNIIATDPGSSSDAVCYSIAAPATATVDHNLASDTTASGTGSLDSKTSANQFVSNAAPYDLHIVTGADAKDVGTDLGTTPSGVEIDINGRDRDAQGDTWDMGAHEFVAAAASGNPWYYYAQM